jgi:SepF-like predicted cell division protein (DUF552 family)
MPSFGLFRKQKKPDQPEQPAENVQDPQQTLVAPEATVEESTPEEAVVATPETQLDQPQPQPEAEPEPEPTVPVETAPSEPAVLVAPVEPAAPASKTYLKAMPLRDLADLEGIKTEVQNGNILILRITPLATKSIESVKSAVNELYAFTESVGGDIARLGEERIVICPKSVRIWREKMPVKNESLPTTAA